MVYLLVTVELRRWASASSAGRSSRRGSTNCLPFDQRLRGRRRGPASTARPSTPSSSTRPNCSRRVLRRTPRQAPDERPAVPGGRRAGTSTAAAACPAVTACGEDEREAGGYPAEWLDEDWLPSLPASASLAVSAVESPGTNSGRSGMKGRWFDPLGVPGRGCRRRGLIRSPVGAKSAGPVGVAPPPPGEGLPLLRAKGEAPSRPATTAGRGMSGRVT